MRIQTILTCLAVTGTICGVVMLCPVVTTGYAEESEELKLETMTVTAQKQEENVQEVPISMTVFDEFTIEDSNKMLLRIPPILL